MGLYDNLKCSYPLPKNFEWAQDKIFQTKDTPAQFLDNYEIRADGTLWHEVYEIEDRSDPTKEGLDRIVGMMTRVNRRWLQVSDFMGEIRFYDFADEVRGGWIEFSAYFVDGKLKEINLFR